MIGQCRHLCLRVGPICDQLLKLVLQLMPYSFFG